ncbi:MAG: serine hydrolase domain-containing protein, partial [Microbacterium sp.]
MGRLPRASASSCDVDGERVIAFLDAVRDARIELHSVMLMRHGSVVAEGWWEPYDADTPHLLYSLSKSFASVAAGIAESEGLLAMDDLLSAHLPEAASYGTATIADALRMSVGHLLDPVLDPSNDAPVLTDGDLRALLAGYAPERAPGEIFTYDQLATFAVTKIVEQAAGCSLIDYLRPRVLDPLGASEAKWYGGETNPGFTGLYLCTESIASFGQLLLQRGQWQGEQLVPEAWLATATSTQMLNDSAHRFPPGQPVETDSGLGYGYQFWMSQHGYHAGGAYSQLCLVLPEQDAVVAITASTQQGQAMLDAIWAHLIPALEGGGDAAADERLAARLTGLREPAPVAGLPALARAT